MKFYTVGGQDSQYAKLFTSFGLEETRNTADAAIAVFTGGEDVSPNLYGASKHPATHNNIYRDRQEEEYFRMFGANNIPMIGICRGGQFLNVMNGGAMYQHVSHHCGSHLITDLQTGDNIYSSSTHHQMMKPAGNALIVATAALGGSREWYEGTSYHKDTSKQDIEVVYYEETKSLCFQPHPEFYGYKDCPNYLYTLMKRFTLI